MVNDFLYTINVACNFTHHEKKNDYIFGTRWYREARRASLISQAHANCEVIQVMYMFSVVSQNTILRITNSVATQTESLNLVFETNWKCKPRQQKLIQNSDELCSIPNYIPQNLGKPSFFSNCKVKYR